MADITKCVGKYCDIKKICYRHTVKDSYHQSYDDFSYYERGKGVPIPLEIKCGADCKYYMDMGTRKSDIINNYSQGTSG